MQLSARAQVDIAATREAVFDVAADYGSFSRFIHALGPIPGITSAQMHDGAAPAAGAHRDIHLSDNTTVEELITAFDRPSRHSYRWVRPPAPPFSLLVRIGEGDWRFEPGPRGHGTRLTWNYRFELTSPLVLPLGLAMRALFARWMRRNLENLRGLIERGG